MTPTNDKIIVRVDPKQKEFMLIGGVKVSLGLRYEKNNREKQPVIAQVQSSSLHLDEGDHIICHHNHFAANSPYFLQDDFYSIPANHTIFAIIHAGGLLPVFGNVLAAKTPVFSSVPVAPENQQYHHDRGMILDGGWTKFERGDVVFTRPHALYEIVYILEGVEHRVCKIDSRQICAVVPKK